MLFYLSLESTYKDLIEQIKSNFLGRAGCVLRSHRLIDKVHYCTINQWLYFYLYKIQNTSRRLVPRGHFYERWKSFFRTKLRSRHYQRVLQILLKAFPLSKREQSQSILIIFWINRTSSTNVHWASYLI